MDEFTPLAVWRDVKLVAYGGGGPSGELQFKKVEDAYCLTWTPMRGRKRRPPREYFQTLTVFFAQISMLEVSYSSTRTSLLRIILHNSTSIPPLRFANYGHLHLTHFIDCLCKWNLLNFRETDKEWIRYNTTGLDRTIPDPLFYDYTKIEAFNERLKRYLAISEMGILFPSKKLLSKMETSVQKDEVFLRGIHKRARAHIWCQLLGLPGDYQRVYEGALTVFEKMNSTQRIPLKRRFDIIKEELEFLGENDLKRIAFTRVMHAFIVVNLDITDVSGFALFLNLLSAGFHSTNEALLFGAMTEIFSRQNHMRFLFDSIDSRRPFIDGITSVVMQNCEFLAELPRFNEILNSDSLFKDFRLFGVANMPNLSFEFLDRFIAAPDNSEFQMFFFAAVLILLHGVNGNMDIAQCWFRSINTQYLIDLTMKMFHNRDQCSRGKLRHSKNHIIRIDLSDEVPRIELPSSGS